MRLTALLVVTIAVLGAAWYELSGGGAFEPGDVGVTLMARPGSNAMDGAPPRPTADPAPVSRPLGTETAARDPADDGSLFVSEPGAGLMRTVAPEPETRRVAENRTVLRSGPGLRFDRVTELLQGERVAVLAEDPRGWVELRADGGITGWVRTDDLLVVPVGN